MQCEERVCVCVVCTTVWQYVHLLKTVGSQLDLNLGATALRRLTDAAAGAARDALFQQRQDMAALVRSSLSRLRDDNRRTTEMLERCENGLTHLRSVLGVGILSPATINATTFLKMADLPSRPFPSHFLSFPLSSVPFPSLPFPPVAAERREYWEPESIG